MRRGSTPFALALVAILLAAGCNNTVNNYYGNAGPQDLAPAPVLDAAVAAVADMAVPADLAAPADLSTTPGDQAMGGASYGTCGKAVHTCVCNCGNKDPCSQACYDNNPSCSQCLQDWATNCIGAFCNKEQTDFLDCAMQFNCAGLAGLDMACVKAHCQPKYDALNNCANLYTWGAKADPQCHDPYLACIGTIDPRTGNPVCP